MSGMQIKAVGDPRSDSIDGLTDALRDRLVTDVGDPTDGDDPKRRIAALVEREAGVLDPETRARVAARVAERAIGFGPLEPLLRDPEVDELMVSGIDPVWVERGGRVVQTSARFTDESELRHVIERILAPLGRRADESEPICDARLPDGSRVNVVLPPLALDGPLLTIRRFRPRGFTPQDLVANGTLSRELLELLAGAVVERQTILICGATGSGKTTTLSALATFFGDDERVITIEDAAELRLNLTHVVRLESRPPNLEGRGEVTIRQLVKNALRMRPDRLIVGEVRGSEALDLLVALQTGHDGSMCTVHAGSAAEALRRIETLALMAELGLPPAAIRAQIADAIGLVVCQARMADGSRKIVEIAEVLRRAGEPAIHQLYAHAGYRPRGSRGMAAPQRDGTAGCDAMGSSSAISADEESAQVPGASGVECAVRDETRASEVQRVGAIRLDEDGAPAGHGGGTVGRGDTSTPGMQRHRSRSAGGKQPRAPEAGVEWPRWPK